MATIPSEEVGKEINVSEKSLWIPHLTPRLNSSYSTSSYRTSPVTYKMSEYALEIRIGFINLSQVNHFKVISRKTQILPLFKSHKEELPQKTIKSYSN